MDRHDVRLAFALGYFLAIVMHATMAWMIRRRGGRSLEIHLFGVANIALAGWHLAQCVELLAYGRVFALGDTAARTIWAIQLLLSGVVLVLFFHLLCTFERVYRRPAPSLRAAITKELHRRERFWVPAAYFSLAAAAALYLADMGAPGGGFGWLRERIGPTSAYLFGGTLLFMTFVLFPARPGQERIVVPAMSRVLLLFSLAVNLLLLALWHDAHPARTRLILLPWLHLHSVAFVIFLAMVRYEFSFMDSYVRNSLRAMVWVTVVCIAYFLFNRVSYLSSLWGRTALSLTRIGILFAGVSLAPWAARRVAQFSDRVLFDRRVDLEEAVHVFARRMMSSQNLNQLVSGAADDIAHAVHSKKVHVVIGRSAKAKDVAEQREAGFRLRIPMGDPADPNGWVLVGERRNLYPYFDGERNYLRVVAELLGGAVHGVRNRDSGASTQAMAEDIDEELPFELARKNRELSQLRLRLRGERERFDPEMVSDVLAIADELGGRDPAAALDVVRSLERVLRHALTEGVRRSTLGTEMAFARDYLALEKLRLRNRLEVTLGYDGSLDSQLVPHRLLQPLIENSLHHGLRREIRVGEIHIHGGAENGIVELFVEDNGSGLPPSFAAEDYDEGGLARLRLWMRECFGEAAALHVEPRRENGVRVRLRFPRRPMAEVGDAGLGD